ncbi:MAG TPA: TonB-dependent receptor [Flavobacteriaceae bacterium]|nr:TonB-dependent receptor [Flavobacteriaceae bacterium]
MRKAIFTIFTVIVCIGYLQAQENPLPTERLIIIKPYSPEVSDAFKMKQLPKLNDSLTTSKEQPEYSVLSVPVASTFVPEKGTAAEVETEPQASIYDNYARLGFGNYTTILGEFYGTYRFNDSQNLGISFAHNSSQGGIDGVLLDDKFYDTELGLDFSSNGIYYNWGVQLDAMHKLVNWYGLPEGFFDLETINSIDPQQSYYGVSLGGDIEYYEGLFDRAELTYRRFGDAYGSGENHVRFAPEFGVPIGEQTISLDIFADYVSGNFDQHYFSNEELKYSNFNFGAHPSLMIHAGKLSVDLGAEVVYAMDLENDKNDFFIYPKVKASYRVADGYFVPYAGVDGGLVQNTYYDFVQENPFVSPTLQIVPTNNMYKAFVGAKGKFTENVGYNFSADYGQSDNKAFFSSHPRGMVAFSGENYQFGNSFGVVYDDLNTLGLHAELNATVNEKLQLRLNASYFDYETDEQAEAWNLPEIKASLNANYQITEKWSAGADLFFVGERKERDVIIGDFPPYETVTVIPLDSYFDANLEVGYQFNDRLSAFLKGSNLFGENYERWKNFPVQGIQVLGGVTYQFNW